PPFLRLRVDSSLSLCDVNRLANLLVFVFFFQAEDGIRDRNVTGVQTCALPIFAADLLHTKSIDSLKAAAYGVKWLEHASSIVHSLYPDYNTQISAEEFERISQSEVDEERLTAVLTHLREKEVKIVPTLSLYRHLAEGRTFNPSE